MFENSIFRLILSFKVIISKLEDDFPGQRDGIS